MFREGKGGVNVCEERGAGRGGAARRTLKSFGDDIKDNWDYNDFDA